MPQEKLDFSKEQDLLTLQNQLMYLKGFLAASRDIEKSHINFFSIILEDSARLAQEKIYSLKEPK